MSFTIKEPTTRRFEWVEVGRIFVWRHYLAVKVPPGNVKEKHINAIVLSTTLPGQPEETGLYISAHEDVRLVALPLEIVVTSL